MSPSISPTSAITDTPTVSPTATGPTAVRATIFFSGITLHDFNNDTALLIFLKSDLASSTGVSEARVNITGVASTSNSGLSTVKVQYTVVFGGAEAANAGATALANPTLTIFSYYVSASGQTLSYVNTEIVGIFKVPVTASPTVSPMETTASPLESPTEVVARFNFTPVISPLLVNANLFSFSTH